MCCPGKGSKKSRQRQGARSSVVQLHRSTDLPQLVPPRGKDARLLCSASASHRLRSVPGKAPSLRSGAAVFANTQQMLARVAKGSGRGIKAFTVALVTLLRKMFFQSAE